MEISNWVRRQGDPGAKWHLVESIIAGAAITNCGRRLEWQLVGRGVLDVSPVVPLTRMPEQPQLCRQCT